MRGQCVIDNYEKSRAAETDQDLTLYRFLCDCNKEELIFLNEIQNCMVLRKKWESGLKIAIKTRRKII